jgi:hypothetical protein
MSRFLWLATYGGFFWLALVDPSMGQDNAKCRWVPGYGWQCPTTQPNPRPTTGSGRARAPQQPAEEIVRVIVPHGGRTGAEDHGSGVLVVGPDDHHGWVLTAEHVTKHRRDAIVEFPDGRRYRATVVRSNRADDVALLRIAKPHVSPRKVAEGEPAMSAAVYLAGYPAGGAYRSWVTRRATIYESGKKLEVLGNAQNGTSGGPMIDERGRVVSVISTTQRAGAGRWTTSGCLTGRLRDILQPAPNITPIQKPIRRPPTTPDQLIDYERLASLVAAKLPKPARGEKGERGERGLAGPAGTSADAGELSALRQRITRLEAALQSAGRERNIPAYFELVPRRK